MPLRIYIDPALTYRNKLRYVFDLIAVNKKISIDIVDDSQADLKITSGASSDFFISQNFYRKLDERKFKFDYHFSQDCMVRDEEGREDLLSTIFYCVNSVQEYDVPSEDVLGRFEFRQSFQAKFNLQKENYVQQLIDRVCEHPRIRQLPLQQRKSKVFLTHDIDSIHGAWMEDGFYAFKKLKFGKLFNVLLNEALG